MISTLRTQFNQYPRQFWLMFAGMLISTTGSSMIWPFLLIYVSSKLDLPLTMLAGLMTINAGVGVAVSFIAGPVIDRLGRKWAMVISLAANGLGYLLMSQADSLPAFALLMAWQGAFNPLYRVGADAMMADLIPPEQRVDGYALMRLSNNLGISVGPAVGGFVAASSYNLSFALAATGLITYSLLILFFARETLPREGLPTEKKAGYGPVFADRTFLTFCLGMTLVQFCAALMWILLGVYMKDNFAISESQYGWLPTTNAILVVSLQVWITTRTKRFGLLPMLMIGAAIYGMAATSVAWGQGFWWFWGSMVLMTLGELVLVPSSSTYTANRAPAEMRGRYMSVYGLTWSAAAGIAPVVGGFLSDTISPAATWYGGGVAGLLALGVLVGLWAREKKLGQIRRD
ncbi:MAG: MFS transporter [Anaerolineaceae bacterium]|nr:MFS transporter [Anaerolineaceae bacterium]